jgi:hypothetical protein
MSKQNGTPIQKDLVSRVGVFPMLGDALGEHGVWVQVKEISGDFELLTTKIESNCFLLCLCHD